MLSRTRAQGLRVLWVLDEFDAARWVLDEKCYFQFIRTLSSETDRYNMTTVLISRSPVAEIERSADGISTFHGVFATFPAVRLQRPGHGRVLRRPDGLRHLPRRGDEAAAWRTTAAGSPICSPCSPGRLAEDQMQQRTVDADRVDEIFARRLRGDIEDFYMRPSATVFRRTTSWRPCWGRCSGPMTLEEQRNVSVLEQRGYLSEDENGYYSMTRDFTIYLELQQTNIPLFETLIRAERRLKEMIQSGVPRHGVTCATSPAGPRRRRVRRWATALGPYQSAGLPGHQDFPGKDLHQLPHPRQLAGEPLLPGRHHPGYRGQHHHHQLGRPLCQVFSQGRTSDGSGGTGWRSSTRSATLSCTPTDT